MRRIRHFIRLLRDIGGYAVVNRAYWIVPLVVILLVFSALILAGQVAAPFTIYPLF